MQGPVILLYTTIEKFGVVGTIFLMFFFIFFMVSIKSLMLTKAAFIWLNIGL